MVADERSTTAGDGSSSPPRPDAVASAAAVAAAGPSARHQEESPPFDEGEYQAVRKRYLEKGVRPEAELRGGMVLKRQTKPPLIDLPMDGYRRLKKEIKRLEGKKGRRRILPSSSSSASSMRGGARSFPRFLDRRDRGTTKTQ